MVVDVGYLGVIGTLLGQHLDVVTIIRMGALFTRVGGTRESPTTTRLFTFPLRRWQLVESDLQLIPTSNKHLYNWICQ